MAAAFAAIVALGVLYYAIRRPLLTIYDASIYVTGAQSLAEGHGYQAMGYLGEPTITYYPPGYSVALAGLFKLSPSFPANLPLLQPHLRTKAHPDARSCEIAPADGADCVWRVARPRVFLRASRRTAGRCRYGCDP